LFVRWTNSNSASKTKFATAINFATDERTGIRDSAAKARPANILEQSPSLQHQLGLISNEGLYFLRELGQKPRQHDRQTNMVVLDINRTRGDLTQSAYAELQMIPSPNLVLERKHLLKSRRHAAQTRFQTPDRFLFPE
jgi:hypothetical protein